MPNFTVLDVSHSPLFLKMAKIWPYYGQTWSSHGPSNWFFPKHKNCAQGCSMPKFRVLASILTDIFNVVTMDYGLWDRPRIMKFGMDHPWKH